MNDQYSYLPQQTQLQQEISPKQSITNEQTNTVAHPSGLHSPLNNLQHSVDPYQDQTQFFSHPVSSPAPFAPYPTIQPVIHAVMPLYPMRVVYCVNPNMRAQQSRKRPSMDLTPPSGTKRHNSLEHDHSSLRVFMSYLRQQYAFCPRWWFLFRLVVNNITSRNVEQKDRKRKERKLLASYLHISFDKAASTQLDRCFTRSNLATVLPVLLSACEEVLSFGCLINPWVFQSPVEDDTRIYSRRKEEAADDKNLHDKLVQYQNKNYERFEAFMNVFEHDVDKQRRLFKILQDALEQYLTVGYVDTNATYENLFTAIYSNPSAVNAFRNLMDNYFCVFNKQ